MSKYKSFLTDKQDQGQYQTTREQMSYA